MKTTEIKVIRTCRETGKKEKVSLGYAIEKCTGWWINIEEMLLAGAPLWTPYAEYQIENQFK